MKKKNKQFGMTVKGIGAVCLSTVLAAGVLTGCGSSNSSADNKTVTIWATGSDNTKVQLEAQIANFNSIQSDYVAELQYITSGTGAQGLDSRIIAAKKAGQTNTDFDLIELSEGSIDAFLEQGGEDLFETIDTSQLSNYKNLTATNSYRKDIMIPYRGTTVGIAYNSETVPNPPKTAEELYQWIQDNPGRFAYNTPGSGGAGGSFVLTTVYNFLPEEALTSSDEKYMDQWTQGFDLLKELHPYMYQSGGKVVYPNKNQGTLDLLANKEVDIIPAWADMVLSQKKLGTMPESIQFAQISPALTGETVGWSIPSIGSNSEGAMAFIDYMLSPEAQNIAVDTQAAIPVIDFSLLDQNLVSTISSLDVSAFRLSAIGSLGTTLQEKWDAEIGTLQ